MKQFGYFLLAVLISITLSCSNEPIKTIQVTDNASLVLTTGGKFKIDKYNSDYDLNYEISNGVLRVYGNSKAILSMRSEDYSQVEYLIADSNAKISTINSLIVDFSPNLIIKTSGNASVDVLIFADSLNVIASHSSEVKVWSMNVRKVLLYTKDSAIYDGLDFTANSYFIDLADYSVANVSAEYISGSVTDHAILKYKGDPTLDIVVTDSAQVVRLED